MTLRGGLGDGEAGERVWAVYVVDVSGSTSDSGWDCDRNGAVDIADDLNQDGDYGEVLDCEIAGTIALNTSLAAIPGSESRIRVALVPFGSFGAVADVGGNPGSQDFVSATEDQDAKRDNAADVVQAAGSMDQGSIELFDELSLGASTDFDEALASALDALAPKQGRKVIFMLTDGFGTLTQSTIDRVRSQGVELRPFAVTPASDECEADGPLDRLGKASGFPCVYTEDPTRLTAAITGQPSSLNRIEVSVDGKAPVQASVDPLGNWSLSVALTPGGHAAVATAYFADGTTKASAALNFVVSAAGLRFVALGDSYSAGEGISPWSNTPGTGQGCHQSELGYATFVGKDGYKLPVDDRVALDYVACSGAKVKDVTAVRQNARGEAHIVQLDRVGPDADLVALTIGGNDLGFAQIGEHCALQIHCYNDGYARLSSGRELSLADFIYARLTLLQPELRALYGTLRDRTGDRASIVAMDYPELLDDGIAVRFGCREAAVLDRAERQYLNLIAGEFRTVISNSAADAGIWFADVIPEFAGHRICDGGVNAKSEWIVGWEAAAKWPPVGDASFHPNAEGAKAYARVLTRFLREGVPANTPKTPAGLPRNPGATARQAPQAVPRARAATAAAAPQPLPAFTPQELDEVRDMSFGSIDVTGLSVLRGVRRCPGRVALGEHVVVAAQGFAPGAPLTGSVKVNAELADREIRTPLVADGAGALRVSLVVPRDIAAASGFRKRGPLSLMSVRLQGTGANGAPRTLLGTVEVDRPGGACARSARRAGDLARGRRAAPSAARTPGVPPVLLAAYDTTRPVLRSAKVSRGRGGKMTLLFQGAEPATLEVRVSRPGGRSRLLVRKKVRAGRGRLELPTRSRRHRLATGRYRLSIRLIDAAGNRSKAKIRRVVVR